MSAASELVELHDLIGGLRRCVTSLQSRCADTPAMRRVLNDVERIVNDIELLDIDAAELDLASYPVQHSGEKIAVPDIDYDATLWRDADDEGIGGHRRP